MNGKLREGAIASDMEVCFSNFEELDRFVKRNQSQM